MARSWNSLDYVAMLLVIIGGLNWGLVALFEFDLVAALTGNDFGETNIASRLIYGLVGLSALFMIYFVSRFLPRRMLIVESEWRPLVWLPLVRSV